MFVDFLTQPRPLSSEVETIRPRPIAAPESRQIAAKGKQEQEGMNESDRLLQAIVVLARREPQTTARRMALRQLIVKCSREISLDF